MEEAISKEQLEKGLKDLETVEKEDPNLTEVTTLAKEEKKGAKLPKLTKEQQKDMAMQDYLQNMAQISSVIRKVSKRGIVRAFVASLQLPQEGMRVSLRSNEEKALFGMAQRALNARMSLILHYIEEQALQAKQNKQEETQNGSNTNSETNPSAKHADGVNSPEPDSDRSSVEQNVEEGK